MPLMAMHRPVMLTGVRRSSKMDEAMRTVRISLRMPATERVTTDVRWIRLFE